MRGDGPAQAPDQALAMTGMHKDQPSHLQQVGDDKGEGSQRDIATDSVETSHDADPAAPARGKTPADAQARPAEPGHSLERGQSPSPQRESGGRPGRN